MGGGDAKFLTAMALWIGFTPELADLCGAGIALRDVSDDWFALCARSNVVLPNALSRQEWIVRLHDRKSGIPYGITIAIAGLQVYPATAWFQMIGSGL